MRLASDGERLTTLDGVERTLDADWNVETGNLLFAGAGDGEIDIVQTDLERQINDQTTGVSPVALADNIDRATGYGLLATQLQGAGDLIGGQLTEMETEGIGSRG